MEIAITGATGFVGSVLVPMLLAEGHTLRLLTRKPQPLAPKDGIIWIKGDLSDKESLHTLTKGAAILIHLAAVISVSDQPSPYVQDINTLGTQNLFLAAKNAGIKRCIHLSSITAYNQFPYDEVLDETRGPVLSTTPGYDYSKLVSETLALSFNDENMQVLVLSPTAIVGPYDSRPSLIGKAIINIYKGKIPALFPGGVDFVDVRDVAIAIRNAITKGTPGRVYILSGYWRTLQELAGCIGTIRGKRISLPVVPLWLVFSMLPLVKAWAALTGGPPYYTKQSVYNLIYSNKKISHAMATTALDFNPRPFETTIRETLEWFKQTGVIS
ncbi:NAD-dependent epimerase/dehydratase family protein [Chitinophaga silvatica]|uniref:NAD-dependent epimerase/dehydratase family protein n=1 Tax=Chitinophaga silvatica TaxID=2282649 RepID=A0A3E1Y3W2_9BACT|nr:NAD-dependent epimerase/dehydratase family protein [Chitinophaga silvatica]RFS19371.1 NAD-dependent epimerase/dehydratase family protein [Chitinophaga silvatica]